MSSFEITTEDGKWTNEVTFDVVSSVLQFHKVFPIGETKRYNLVATPMCGPPAVLPFNVVVRPQEMQKTDLNAAVAIDSRVGYVVAVVMAVVMVLM